MGLLTTTTGWFPKPVAVRRARWRFTEEEIGVAELRNAEDAALRDVLKLQEEIGLDVFVDGQMDRGDMIAHFAGQLAGMESLGLVRVYGNRYYRRPRIVGAVAREEPITVERFRAAHALASKPVKAVVTGPYTLMDWSFDEHYRSREDCCLALAEAIRAEVVDLEAAGALEIQIDEPAISARPEEMALAAEALQRVTSALSGSARTWVHLGCGDLLPVMSQVVKLEVDGLSLEMANSGYETLEMLADLPADKLLAAGVIDVLDPAVENVDVVRARIDRILDVVPAERLRLTPDGGLRTLTASVVRAKLESMVAAASAYSA
jgi:5-methyltetrahydropteroyltriglutamate--homocysteine methyltransferase